MKIKIKKENCFSPKKCISLRTPILYNDDYEGKKDEEKDSLIFKQFLIFISNLLPNLEKYRPRVIFSLKFGQRLDKKYHSCFSTEILDSYNWDNPVMLDNGSCVWSFMYYVDDKEVYEIIETEQKRMIEHIEKEQQKCLLCLK
jgi:hypothetical protein